MTKKREQYRLQFHSVVSLLLLLFLLSGCSALWEEPVSEEKAVINMPEESPFGIVPDVSYEVPKSIPKVMVNQEGYDIKSKKLVVFQGEGLSDTFEVVDAKTQKTVYTGKIKNGRYGYFTELEQAGAYYIRTDVIGESYRFSIEKNRYLQTFDALHKNYSENIKDIDEAIPILLAYEFYPGYFRTDKGSSNSEVPLVLESIRKVMDEYLVLPITEYEDEEQAMLTAGALAKFAYQYKNYDNSYANKCLNLAEKLWRMEAAKIDKESDSYYFAAAELYRALGYEKYHAVIKSIALKEKTSPVWEEQWKLYGDITYLSTRRRVDVEICNVLMDAAMEEAERIAKEAKENPALPMDDSLEHMLVNALQLITIDHIITSHEYSGIVENQLHYFWGCNAQGKNYQEELEENPLFLFIMVEIAENFANMEE